MENSLAQNSKDAIRKNYLKTRNVLTKDKVSEKSNAVVAQFTACSAFAFAEKILIYSPIKNEVLANLLIDTYPNKTFFLPVIQEKTLIAQPYSANVAPNKFGILEPCLCNESYDVDIQIVIVPCVGVDIVGNRLGYGKGYYDRYFAKLNKEKLFPLMVGLIYDFQFSHVIFPTQSHDIQLNAVVTEQWVRFFK